MTLWRASALNLHNRVHAYAAMAMSEYILFLRQTSQGIEKYRLSLKYGVLEQLLYICLCLCCKLAALNFTIILTVFLRVPKEVATHKRTHSSGMLTFNLCIKALSETLRAGKLVFSSKNM